ncbi:polysaccharide pyruvyl transferase family protein [Rufibacter immobilis]|uniref:Polysaccharide pyruvyl transferase family protein n=1 Tax=Rufibacter immobilis TaxID=1348778 RepID=A0A3M9MZD7_9BACT|nr:polysaccharide pyruvyl transferase family protein [Rufibacter immobilis]RNI30860.1 polysaccharide pyruvyl transferase family protein [Rufibacter immobilis]
MKMIKIGMFSFADINNYGDILFSHIFKREVEARIPNVKITFFTPADALVEGFSYEAYTSEKVNEKYDALILAGGEVVHFYDERTWFPIYKKSNLEVASAKPSDVVWDWALNCKSSFKAWLSVGVRPFEDTSNAEKVDSVINTLDYISVRGILSKKILENKIDTYNSKITITPDLGWLFPDLLLSSGEYGVHFGKFISSQKYVIYQVNNINNEEAKLIAQALLAFEAQTGLKVYLLPVIHPWEDEKYLALIEEYSEGKVKMLPATLTTMEIADVILHAELVLCSSLHTAITALAFGIPSAIINKWQGTKLQDLFGLQFRTEFLSSDFNMTYDMLMKLYNTRDEQKPALKLYADFMKEKLKSVFDELCTKILSH